MLLEGPVGICNADASRTVCLRRSLREFMNQFQSVLNIVSMAIVLVHKYDLLFLREAGCFDHVLRVFKP